MLYSTGEISIIVINRLLMSLKSGDNSSMHSDTFGLGQEVIYLHMFQYLVCITFAIQCF